MSPRLRQIDQQRIAFHIASLTEEMEKTNEKISELVKVINTDEKAYEKIRKLQLTREIQQEQLDQMHAALRAR